jgi:hypothetical protein
LSGAKFVRKRRRQRRFDLSPWHAIRKNRQRMSKVDHLPQPGVEKIGALHRVLL